MMQKNRLAIAIRRLMGLRLYRFLIRHTRIPRIGKVNFGDLYRLEPISKAWGADRGLPIDRYYIEKFLQQYSGDIRGRVLEFGNRIYTETFGRDRVLESEIIDVSSENPIATIRADLMDAPQIPSGSFDCIICTQTLHLIPDLKEAVQTLHRVLKPGGVVLATLPAVSRNVPKGRHQWADHWRLSSRGAEWLFGEIFGSGSLRVHHFGNVLAAITFLHGIATEELESEELDHSDPDFEVLIAVRACK